MLSIIIVLMIINEADFILITSFTPKPDEDNDFHKVKRQADKSLYASINNHGRNWLNLKVKATTMSNNKKGVIMSCGLSGTARLAEIKYIKLFRFKSKKAKIQEVILKYENHRLSMLKDSEWMKNAIYEGANSYVTNENGEKVMKIEIPEDYLFNQKFRCVVYGNNMNLVTKKFQGFITMYTQIKNKKQFLSPSTIMPTNGAARYGNGKGANDRGKVDNEAGYVAGTKSRVYSADVIPQNTSQHKSDEANLIVIGGAVTAAIIFTSIVIILVLKIIRR